MGDGLTRKREKILIDNQKAGLVQVVKPLVGPCTVTLFKQVSRFGA
jgi:hypothetical protein